jgi:fatty acid kinase fatty acid binding subunit
MIHIVTDSTCDLPDSLIKQHNIHVTPIHIQFGTETFRDGETIDKATFYRRIEQEGALPKTSQPPPSDFVKIYQTIASPLDEILSIHVTGKLSGTFNSAQMAAEAIAEQVRVHVFDSLAGSAGLGFMCLEAARLAEAGKSTAEILKRLEAARPHVNHLFMLANLKFAEMSGRVNRLQATLASLLNVKPIVSAEGGMIQVVEQVRTRKKAIERVLELARERVGDAKVNLAVIHAQAPEEAVELLERAKLLFHCGETFVHDLALSLAVHFGPGTLAIVTYPAE